MKGRLAYPMKLPEVIHICFDKCDANAVKLALVSSEIKDDACTIPKKPLNMRNAVLGSNTLPAMNRSGVYAEHICGRVRR